MRRLVAVDLPAGEGFFAVLRRAFDEGDAIFPLDPRLPAPARRALLGAIRPGAIVDAQGFRLLEDGLPTEEGDALVVATSGTTGEPKAAVLGLDAVVASAWATCRRLGVDPASDRLLACLPLAHVGGLSVLTRALVSGTPIEIQSGFDPVEVKAALGRGASVVSLVATALARLGPEAAAFRRIVLGGAAAPAAIPRNVVTTYGLTETGSGVVYDGVPLDGVEVAIGPDGVISLRGPMLLRRYRDGSDPKDAAGWLRTGDVGSFGAGGRLVVHGRLDEVIVTGGEKVWPQAVEDVICTLAGVAECAVAGVADPEWGSRVVAFVVPQKGAASYTLDEVRGLVRAELGPVAAPKELVIVARLPRTALGKVRRGELVALAGASSR